jgi:hypothetical protein
MDVLVENLPSRALHLLGRPTDLSDKGFVHVAANICVFGGDSVAPTSKGMKSLAKVFPGLSQVRRHTALGILQYWFTVCLCVECWVARKLRVSSMGECGEDVDGGCSKVDGSRCFLFIVVVLSGVATR